MIITDISLGSEVMGPGTKYADFVKNAHENFVIDYAPEPEADETRAELKIADEVHREIIKELKPILRGNLDKIDGELSEADAEANLDELRPEESELKLPIKYRMLKRLYHRLDNFVDKLVDKYERLSQSGKGPRMNLKKMKHISNILDTIDKVQEKIGNKIERIEKRSGRDITVFDGLLDKLDGLEDKFEELHKDLSKMILKRIRKIMSRRDLPEKSVN